MPSRSRARYSSSGHLSGAVRVSEARPGFAGVGRCSRPIGVEGARSDVSQDPAATEAEARAARRGPDPVRAAQAESALWAMWCRSDSPGLDARLAEAIAAMERRDLAGAEASLPSLIVVAPAWAEAWNKRATVRYLAGDYPGSIADCREALARRPHHLGGG